MLNSRDGNGYPLQGYEFIPRWPKPNNTLSELLKLLQQANERVEQLKDTMQCWKRKYKNLNQEYLAFKLEDLCERCQTIRDTTPPGDTITLCSNCSRDKDTAASLTLKLKKKETELQYWQDCYETLLQQHFEDDRRSHDGAHERV